MKKKVVVTGATSGFGCLLVKTFLEAGYEVFATGRNLSQRAEVFKDLSVNQRHSLVILDLDVTQASQRRALLERLQGQGLDILINNAGTGYFGPIEETEEVKLREIMEVNFFGLFLLTKELLPELRRSQGRIFNFSSVFGFLSFPQSGVYCASKFAVEAFSEALHYEVDEFGVQVCLIEPGGYRTGFRDRSQWTPDHPNKIYALPKRGYQKMMESVTSRTSFQDPRDVALGVLRLAQRKRMPLRQVFGRDAWLSLVLRRGLPQFIYNPLTRFVFSRAFKRFENR